MAQEIDKATQIRLNTPLALGTNFDPQDSEFLKLIVSKIEERGISLFIPSSIINQELYARLTPDAKTKVDMEAFTTLAALREIYGLHKTYQAPTYQLQNLVRKVRLTKETFEKTAGDVFII